MLIIGATAATTAVAGLLQFKQLAADLNVTPSISHADVNVPPPGQPQTLLIIGSDHRAGDAFNNARTDTMLLVRLNGGSQTINVMSIPRDLQVTIPGYGVSKINAAYSDGGPNLLIKTIKANVFPTLHVNHIVDVNFGGFQALVNAIGCVYTDVDHRYYNNTALTNYSSIDIQPGYQKLCGADALAFVRFRHTDSDLVRNARQQDFIRWAKDQYGVDQIISNRDQLLKIFGAHTQTDHDLHTINGLINLFNLVAFSAGHRIKQVKFPAQIQPCTATACFVTADATAEASAFATFMRPTVASAAPAKRTTAGKGKGKRKRAAKLSTAGLMADTADGKSPGGRAELGRNAGLLPTADRCQLELLLEPDQRSVRWRPPAPAPIRAPTCCADQQHRPPRRVSNDAGPELAAGSVLRGPGHDLAASAAARARRRRPSS